MAAHVALNQQQRNKIHL